MTFEAIETSVDDGRPVELLLMAFLTSRWAYTTAEKPITHDGLVYLPLPFEHTEIKPSSDAAKAQTTIKVPQDCPIGELFRVQAPPGVITTTIFVRHAQDAEVKVLWKGRIINAEWNQPWLSLTSESIISSLQRMGLRRKFGIPCPHPLYSIGRGLCNVDKDEFKVVCHATSVSGATITSSELIGQRYDKFAGGYVEWINADTGYQELRMIKSSDEAGSFIITSAPPGLTPGMVMSVYPGCDHSDVACARFDNSLNYGGMKFIPTKNPFNGSILY